MPQTYLIQVSSTHNDNGKKKKKKKKVQLYPIETCNRKYRNTSYIPMSSGDADFKSKKRKSGED